jgi:hypothetical protein
MVVHTCNHSTGEAVKRSSHSRPAWATNIPFFRDPVSKKDGEEGRKRKEKESKHETRKKNPQVILLQNNVYNLPSTTYQFNHNAKDRKVKTMEN